MARIITTEKLKQIPKNTISSEELFRVKKKQVLTTEDLFKKEEPKILTTEELKPRREIPKVDVKGLAKEAAVGTLFPFFPKVQREEIAEKPFRAAEKLTYGFPAVAATRGLERIGVLPKVKELALKGRRVIRPTPLGAIQRPIQEALVRAPEDVAKIAVDIGVDVGTIIGLEKLFQKGIGLIPKAKQLLKERLGRATAEEVAQRVQQEKSIMGALRKLKPDMQKKVVKIWQAERAVTEPQALAKEAIKPTITPEARPPVVAPKVKPIQPLIEEAKKYKSAEEWIKAQGQPLYHGTSQDFDRFDILKAGTLKRSDWGRVGIYFDPRKSGADYYRTEAVTATDKKAKKLYQDYVDKAKELGTKPMYESIDLGFDTPKYNELKKVLNKYLDYVKTLEADKSKGRIIEAYIKPDAKVYKHIYEPGMITDQYLSDRMMGQGYDVVEIWDRDPDTKEKWLSEVIVMKPDVIVTKSQLTDIWKQAQEAPPTAPPEAPKVEEAFLKQPKPKTSIIQYFKPAEYHLKELGFEEKIAQPVREAMQDFTIELQGKSKFVSNIQSEHHKVVPSGKKKVSDLKIWNFMDKGIPATDQSVEAHIARKYRPETEEMLRRLNEVRKEIGKDEIKGVKNYILHSLKPEILNEIYAKGVIPSELAKVMEYIPPKNLFLRTAEQRKGVPEEWLVKDPHQLMRMMYAIDLKYIHLQRALTKIDPYLRAVKGYREVTEQGMIDEWSPETYKYLDDWIKQAIKMRPSNWDTLVDNLAEYTLAPLLRKTGLKVSHMPWRDFVSTLSAAAHTGALGMRIRPILRNLVQSTFDWVMYGTKPYLKGSQAFLTKEGRAILKKSKVWRTRVPYEAQDIATLNKLFKIGGLGYRASDLHNVGRGLLTRYHHAIDNLKMTPEKAIKWADQDLPSTQWSYRREDLPRAYWTTTGRAFWTLGSWWMNFYTRFLPELLRKAFTGKDVLGRVVPGSERLGVMRLLILAGTLYAVKEHSKEVTGTVIDYTGQVKPTPLREAPIAQMLLSLRDLAQGITDGNDRKTKEALRNLSRTSKIFIPWWLAGQDLYRYISGEKTLGQTLFYGREPKKKLSGIRPIKALPKIKPLKGIQ